MEVRRLLRRFASIIAAAAATCILLFALPRDPQNYLAAIVDKHRALESAPSPKIVIVGGSNVAFSVDSKRLSAATGRTVVNMGIQAGIGLNFMLREVEPNLAQGDVVLLIPEYQHFFTTTYGESELISVLRFYPRAWRYVLTLPQLRNVLLWFPFYARERFMELLKSPTGRIRTDPVYRRNRFNTLGDIDLHLESSPSNFAKVRLFLGRPQDYQLNPQARDLIEQFAERSAARGVRVYLLYPSVPDVLYGEWAGNLALVDHELRRTSKISILDRPQDAVLPANDFYDTAYHLTTAGREVRTDYIIARLDAADLGAR